MKKITPKIIFYVAIIFFVLACLIFFWLYKDIKHKDQVARELEQNLETENDKIANMQSLVKLLENTQEERQAIDSHFINSLNIVPLFNFFENSAPLVGAVAEVMSVDVPKNNENSDLTMDINAKGSFESLYKFLMLIENSPYDLEVVFMDIKKESSNTAGQEWQADLKIRLISFIQ